MDVPGTQRAAFQIAELVEQQQRMITGTGIVPIPDAHLLFAVRWADARIHIENDASGRTATMYIIDPAAGKISESGKVLSNSEPLGLEAAHLARRCTTTRNRFFADDPAYRRTVPQPLGVVHILVSSEASEHRLSQQADKSIP